MGSTCRVEYLLVNSLTYIVLVNWNGWADTIECLESLLKLEDREIAIVVVDNGSTDGSIERIMTWAQGNLNVFPTRDAAMTSFAYPPSAKPLSVVVYDQEVAVAGGGGACNPSLVLVRSLINEGFAGANNVGLRYAMARGDAARVWLLNNDTVVDPHALTAIVWRMNQVPKAGICGSTLLFYNNPTRVQAYGGGRYIPFLGLSWHIGFMETLSTETKPARAERRMNYVVGASLCVSREFLLDIGPMSEDYFLFFEEVDWSYRNKGRYSLLHAPDSLVYHKVGRSIGTSSNPLKRSGLCDYYNLYNRVKFTRRHVQWALPGVYGVMFFSILLRLVLGQWQRAYMALRIMCGTPTRPVSD